MKCSKVRNQISTVSQLYHIDFSVFCSGRSACVCVCARVCQRQYYYTICFTHPKLTHDTRNQYVFIKYFRQHFSNRKLFSGILFRCKCCSFFFTSLSNLSWIRNKKQEIQHTKHSTTTTTKTSDKTKKIRINKLYLLEQENKVYTIGEIYSFRFILFYLNLMRRQQIILSYFIVHQL